MELSDAQDAAVSVSIRSLNLNVLITPALGSDEDGCHQSFEVIHLITMLR